MSSRVRASQRITHSPVTRSGLSTASPFGVEHRLVEAGRQHVDQVDVRGELVVLLPGDAGGDEDAEVADLVVDGVDDGLAVGADVVDAVVEVEDPVERLLRRGDVVALRAEDHDRRADVAQVDRGAVGGADLAGGELVADEELVDDELHLLGVERDVAAPPLLEVEVALGLGVDLRLEVVLLGPERVGRVLVLEVLHQRRRRRRCRRRGRRSSAVSQVPPSRPPE